MTELYVIATEQGWMLSAGGAPGIVFARLRDALLLAENCRKELGVKRVIVTPAAPHSPSGPGGSIPIW